MLWSEQIKTHTSLHFFGRPHLFLRRIWLDSHHYVAFRREGTSFCLTEYFILYQATLVYSVINSWSIHWSWLEFIIRINVPKYLIFSIISNWFMETVANSQDRHQLRHYLNSPVSFSGLLEFLSNLFTFWWLLPLADWNWVWFFLTHVFNVVTLWKI